MKYIREAAAGVLAVVLVLAGGLAVRGCWADSVKDYEVTRRLREGCAARGGVWSAIREGHGCITVQSIPTQAAP